MMQTILLKKNTDPRNNSNTHTLVDMAYHMAGVHDIHLGLCSLLDDYHHRLRDVILDCGLENVLKNIVFIMDRHGQIFFLLFYNMLYDSLKTK